MVLVRGYLSSGDEVGMACVFFEARYGKRV